MALGRWCLFVVVCLPAAMAWPQWQDDVGFTDLMIELGAALPTGAGIDVSMAEAPSGNSYLPNVASGNYSGTVFTDATGTNVGVSNHADGVAATFFGDTTSIAPDVPNVSGFDANDWIDQLGAVTLSTGTEPADHSSFRVQNHSWISTGNDPAAVANASQRIDHLVNRDEVLIIGGSSNGVGGIPDLLANSYNSILVGRSDGNHGHGTTSVYGAGRQRPDIVAPAVITSTSTPMVSSAAALLHEFAAGTANVNDARTVVMRAALMAGATKQGEEFGDWDRTFTRPIDDRYGAGELNVYNSYHVLAGGEFNGSIVAPTTPVGLFGFDHANPLSMASSLRYQFEVPEGYVMDELSIFLQWNIDVQDLLVGPILDPTGDLFSPTVDLSPGGDLADFALTFRDSDGFVVDASDSPVDNFEHIYLTDLAAGLYELEVSGDRGDEFGLAWRSSVTAVPEAGSVVVLMSVLAILGGRRSRQRDPFKNTLIATV
ncbi:MAG: hypothetical protein AAF670_06470 [Planctomycetota bacterium]